MPDTTGPWLASSTAQCRQALPRIASAELRIAGAVIRDQRQPADLHHEIGREAAGCSRRGRARPCRTRPPNASNADARWLRPEARSSYMARCRNDSLEGASPAMCRPAASSLDSRAGSSRPRRGVGRREQPAILQAHADVAAAAGGQPALEQRAADLADLVAQAVLRRMRGLIAELMAAGSKP